ncbi:putative zinc finger protein [Fusarium redolens]|uniref:Zinc finger protein n=1 Tax=Fusarium redolens TaxID=48865 RepID=A0A9P9H1D2_FUSRE|nr:putative zinc finger protein [Fusarium redolens]KAH7248687.1 putative zinc finger protein [Fusarium redolens]
MEQSCGKEFKTLAALINHLESESWHYAPNWECDACGAGFHRRKQCKDHEINCCFYCEDCEQQFSSWHAISQHLNSSRHRGPSHSSVSDYQKGVSCPFCKAPYQAASGVVHHLERGCCPNAPLDRDTLDQEVRRRDPDGFICNKLLEWHGTVSYHATSLAYNSRYGQYECYFCGDLFRQLSSLNQHLASPRHQQELYHCPNRKCLKEFTTLAGMVNHLESESCRFLRFGAVQNGIRGCSE